MSERSERSHHPKQSRLQSAKPRGAQAAAQLDFQALFENAIDIVLLNNRAGRIVMANKAAREFGGYTQEEVDRGVDLSAVLPPDDYEAAMQLTQRAIDGLPIPEVYERHVVLRDGSRRVVELRSNVLRRRRGEPLLQTIGRDVTESRRAVAFQASLVQVSQALLTAQNLQQVGSLVCDEALRVLEVDGVYLWLRQGSELVGTASAGEGSAGFQGVHRSHSDSFVGQLFHAGDLRVINDFRVAHPDMVLAPGIHIESMLAVPLRRSGTAFGVLVFIHTHNPGYFVGPVCDRGLIFAAQTAVAIESALAREREEDEGRVSAALLQVARAIRESLEEAEVLAQITKSTREVQGCDWTFVSLWDEQLAALRIVAMEGMSTELAEEARLMEFRPGDIPEADALYAQQPVEIADTQSYPNVVYRRWNISSFLAFPMVRGGHLIGTISAGYRQRCGPFSYRERRIMEGIASQAAVAVDNARLVEDLRRANNLKSEFLGAMSHELRTPLSAILGYAELMREGVMGALEPQQCQVLDRMLINGRTLLDLVNTTLNVNRLEAGRIAVDFTQFALKELMAELAAEYAARPPEDAVQLQWPALSQPEVMRTDRGKLKVILRNLIDNALKFTPAGTVSMGVQMNRRDERVQLTVADTGVGIAKEEQTAIFEMFRQVDGTRLSSRSGVGLGLYLVRRYVLLLGGEVYLESAPENGSTFTVDLPLGIS
jgi:PAS domain S-box-containing protein